MSTSLLQRAIVVVLVCATIAAAVAAFLVPRHGLDSRRSNRVVEARHRIADALRRRAYYLEDVADPGRRPRRRRRERVLALRPRPRPRRAGGRGRAVDSPLPRRSPRAPSRRRPRACARGAGTRQRHARERGCAAGGRTCDRGRLAAQEGRSPPGGAFGGAWRRIASPAGKSSISSPGPMPYSSAIALGIITCRLLVTRARSLPYVAALVDPNVLVYRFDPRFRDTGPPGRPGRRARGPCFGRSRSHRSPSRRRRHRKSAGSRPRQRSRRRPRRAARPRRRLHQASQARPQRRRGRSQARQ